MKLSQANRLTQRQQEVLTEIRRFYEENGQYPTVSELAKILGVSSLRSVTQYLESLEKKGLLTRTRYATRGIKLVEKENQSTAVLLPVVGAMACGDLTVYADPVFDEYICVDKSFLRGISEKNTVVIRAMGNSMVDAGVKDGDLVITERTNEAQSGDNVVAIIDDKAVLKQIYFMENAVMLKPMSHDPIHVPIVLTENFEIFGKMIDVIKNISSTNELEYVELEN